MKITLSHYAFYLAAKTPVLPSWAKAEWKSDRNLGNKIHSLINMQAPDKRDYGHFIHNMMINFRRHVGSREALIDRAMYLKDGRHKSCRRICMKIIARMMIAQLNDIKRMVA
jgi:hypothetical protein